VHSTQTPGISLYMYNNEEWGFTSKAKNNIR
jgi:hypothetical protein